MNLQLRDLFNAKDSFARLLDEKLPSETALKIRGLVGQINEHFSTLEDERNDLIRKLGTKKSEENEEYEFTAEAQEEFISGFDKLLDTEVELEYETLSIKDLGPAMVSVKDLNTLSFLFRELEEPVAV